MVQALIHLQNKSEVTFHSFGDFCTIELKTMNCQDQWDGEATLFLRDLDNALKVREALDRAIKWLGDREPSASQEATQILDGYAKALFEQKDGGISS